MSPVFRKMNGQSILPIVGEPERRVYSQSQQERSEKKILGMKAWMLVGGVLALVFVVSVVTWNVAYKPVESNSSLLNSSKEASVAGTEKLARLRTLDKLLVDGVVSRFYTKHSDKDLFFVRELFTSPTCLDDWIYDACERHNAAYKDSYYYPTPLMFAANALAVGRFDLYKRLREMAKTATFRWTYNENKMSQDDIVLLLLSRIPHVTQEAVDSIEFLELVSNIELYYMPYPKIDLYQCTLNLPFIKFLERRFPETKRTIISPNGLNMADWYGLTVADVLPGLQHYNGEILIKEDELKSNLYVALVLNLSLNLSSVPLSSGSTKDALEAQAKLLIQDVIETLYDENLKQYLKLLKTILLNQSYADDWIYDACEKAQNKLYSQCKYPMTLTYASNALAVGRFGLYKRLRNLANAVEYDMNLNGKPFTPESYIFLSLSAIPHLTQEAVNSKEFKEIVKAVEENGMPYTQLELYYCTLNLPFIKFLETKFKETKRTVISSEVMNAYGLEAADILPGLQHYNGSVPINLSELKKCLHFQVALRNAIMLSPTSLRVQYE